MDLQERHDLNSLTEDDLRAICRSLRLMLTHAITMIDKSAETHGWTVDKLEAETVVVRAKTISLQGPVEWSNGGGVCKTYQAIIALNTRPLLYSFNLIDHNDNQQFAIHKSYNGWALA